MERHTRTDESPESAPRVRPTEREWRLEATRAAIDAWSYDRSSLRPGTAPELAWSEYPLAAVFRASVTGLHASERATFVFVGDAPSTCSTRPDTVADALKLAAVTLEAAAHDRARSPSPPQPFAPALPHPASAAWLELAASLRARAADPTLAQLSI